LFIYLAWNNVHDPCEAPDNYLAVNSEIQNKARQSLAGMMSAIDDQLTAVVDGFKSAGLWDNTFLIFTTDNGGNLGGSGCNYPLRGGKCVATTCFPPCGCERAYACGSTFVAQWSWLYFRSTTAVVVVAIAAMIPGITRLTRTIFLPNLFCVEKVHVLAGRGSGTGVCVWRAPPCSDAGLSLGRSCSRC
jgi:hypothetical protein